MTDRLPRGVARPWIHAQCEECWNKANPGRKSAGIKNAELVWCCFCALPTSAGIYVHHDPRRLNCEHPPRLIIDEGEAQPFS